MADRSPLLAPAPRTEPLRLPGGRRLPMTLLTGFLGAGKTTLLNRILSGAHGLRIGVLVNDFGAINIDASLVEKVEEHSIGMVNGCVCCEARDDLVDSLEQMLVRVDTVDYVILEASGVADPGGIVTTFLDTKYREALVLDSITCVVDAEGIFRDDEYLLALKLRQIAFADLVLLTKTDLVGPEHVEVIHDWIGAHLQRIRIAEACHGDAPLDVLLATGRFDPAWMPADDAAYAHAPDDFDRWSFQTDRPFNRAALEHMVSRMLPASVYRCKGVVYTDQMPDKPFALQVVGRRTDLAPVEQAARIGTSQIIAIGRGIDRAGLDELFTTTLTPSR